MKKYIDETKKIEELERLLATIKNKVKEHEKEYPEIMTAISSIEDILEKHKRNVETSPEYI
jgi:chromosome segregation ATPase